MAFRVLLGERRPLQQIPTDNTTRLKFWKIGRKPSKIVVCNERVQTIVFRCLYISTKIVLTDSQ